jgi:VWFA-related protein
MAVAVHRLIAALAASVGVAGAALVAQAPQQQPQQPPPPRPPVFRAGSVLVTVDVYPQRDGRLVEGLSTEDFQVTEDGKPQAIDSLELVRVERTLSEAERRDPNTVGESWAIAADPKNRVFVIYLDTLHVSVDGSHNIRRPLVDTLNSLIAPNDLFGVMTPNLQARHLSLGRRTLGVEEQLSRYWTWGERNRITSDPTDPVEDALTRCYSMTPTPQPKEWIVEDDGALRRLDYVLIERRREDRVISSFEDLVVYLTNRREARTVVVLVSDGWRLFQPDRRLAESAAVGGMQVPSTFVGGGTLRRPDLASSSDTGVCATELARLASLDNAQRFRNFLTQANRANVSVYTVAPSGNAVFDTPINQQIRSANPAVASLAVDMNRVRSRVESLQTLAENTDGLAIVKTNDVAGGMKRIVDDVSAYYLLTYYSTNTKNDGRFRRIEVTTRRPGLSIRARRGYTAPSEAAIAAANKAAAAAAPTTPGVEAVPVDAVFGPLSRLRAGAESFSYGVARPTELLVSVELGGSQIVGGPFAKGAGIAIVAAPVAGGSAVGEAQGRIEAGTRGALVRVPLPPGTPGPWRITATIGGGVDRIQERLEIKEATGKLLGDPVPYRATPAPSSPIRAVADFLYRRTERIHVEWPLLGAVDRREARLIARNGQVVALPVALSERTDNGQIVIAADLTLTPLAPADYAIELVVGQGANSERRYIAFRVVP